MYDTEDIEQVIREELQGLFLYSSYFLHYYTLHLREKVLRKRDQLTYLFTYLLNPYTGSVEVC